MSYSRTGGADDLRAEARGMAAAYLDALLEHSAPGAVMGVYLKGSALKPWETEIDYVPEVSDVDIHVRLTGDPADPPRVGRARWAALVAERARGVYLRRFPEALHVPRPQLMVVNDLERHSDYAPSPEGTVETPHGPPYPQVSRQSYETVRDGDRRRFRADADFVRDEVPWKLVDRPGRRAWQVVERLTWRVGPAGPRVLTQPGVHPFDAWSANRTWVARELDARAGPDLAEAYRDFYRAGWEGFRARFRTADPAIRAILAAERLFDGGRRVLDDAR